MRADRWGELVVGQAFTEVAELAVGTRELHSHGDSCAHDGAQHTGAEPAGGDSQSCRSDDRRRDQGTGSHDGDHLQGTAKHIGHHRTVSEGIALTGSPKGVRHSVIRAEKREI